MRVLSDSGAVTETAPSGARRPEGGADVSEPAELSRRRDARAVEVADLEQLRMHAAQDRAAAALDRREAALDRDRAAEYLRQTYRDSLTGALQREAGRDFLTRELERARRTGHGLVIAFLDVVGLKRTNDELGHEAGDNVLRAVGLALTEGFRAYDVVVRWGGDEFVCALPASRLADARRWFEQVQARLGAQAPAVHLSVGLTEVIEGDTLQAAVSRADRDLYARRGRVVG
jgi:diguanylate cyclase (GGDEF)-like protein